MSFFWSKSRSLKLLEGGMHLLDIALGFGLVSGAVLASIFGKLILAGLLVVIALALFFCSFVWCAVPGNRVRT